MLQELIEGVGDASSEFARKDQDAGWRGVYGQSERVGKRAWVEREL